MTLIAKKIIYRPGDGDIDLSANLYFELNSTVKSSVFFLLSQVFSKCSRFYFYLETTTKNMKNVPCSMVLAFNLQIHLYDRSNKVLSEYPD